MFKGHSRTGLNPGTGIGAIPSPCPAPRQRCRCATMLVEDISSLPYKPHLGPKRSRATGPTCRTSVLQRFPPAHRGVVLQVLADPGNNTALLAQLMAPYPDTVEGTTRFKHGCLCCPQAARCQSPQKVDRHLRGLFDIREFLCQFWSVGPLSSCCFLPT